MDEMILTLRLIPSMEPADASEDQMNMLLKVLLATYKLEEMEISSTGKAPATSAEEAS